jgi:hypothetical protein
MPPDREKELPAGGTNGETGCGVSLKGLSGALEEDPGSSAGSLTGTRSTSTTENSFANAVSIKPSSSSAASDWRRAPLVRVSKVLEAALPTVSTTLLIESSKLGGR